MRFALGPNRYLSGRLIDPVLVVEALFDQTQSDQPLQPIGQDVGRNTLGIILEILVAMLVEQGHVANQQQRPLVAEEIQRGCDRAGRSGLKLGAGFNSIHWR